MATLPVGSVVEYSYPDEGKAARLIVVAHSHEADGSSPLLMLAEHPIAPPLGAKLYDPINLLYSLHAGWRAGHVPVSTVRDTGEVQKVIPWEMHEIWQQFKGRIWDGEVWRDRK